MTPIRSIILSVDDWVDGRDEGATIDAPDEDTLREALRALDGKLHTTITMHVMGKEETCWLAVARGDGRYAVSATLDGEEHHVARDLDEAAVTRAALYFLDFGRLDPATPWQPLDE